MFRTRRIDKIDAGQRVSNGLFAETALLQGDVAVRVTHFMIDDRDGLANTGRSPHPRSATRE